MIADDDFFFFFLFVLFTAKLKQYIYDTLILCVKFSTKHMWWKLALSIAMCVDKYQAKILQTRTVHAFMCNLRRLKCGNYFLTLYLRRRRWNHWGKMNVSTYDVFELSIYVCGEEGKVFSWFVLHSCVMMSHISWL